jgi:hypothetical protein
MEGGVGGRRPPKVLEGGRRPDKRFFRLGGRFMAAPTQKPRKKIKNRKKKKINEFFIIIFLNIK